MQLLQDKLFVVGHQTNSRLSPQCQLSPRLRNYECPIQKNNELKIKKVKNYLISNCHGTKQTQYSFKQSMVNIYLQEIQKVYKKVK